MKKLYILFLLAFITGCSSFGNKEGIEKAKTEAIEAVNKAKDKAIKDAKAQIATAATTQLMEANDSIKNAIENAKITIKEMTMLEVDSRLKETDNRIKNSALLGLIGTFLGVIGIVAACIAVKRTKVSRGYIYDILCEAIYKNEEVKSRIEMLVKTSTNNKPIGQQLTKKNVEDIIRLYLYSNKEFQDYLYNYVKGLIGQHNNNTDQGRTNSSSSRANLYELFARDSMTNILSNVQTSFQSGKSIYKLILNNADSTNAEITLCIERADVKQRILGNDSQFIEAICDVRKVTNAPTEIEVKEKGIAEKSGDDWKVTKKIIVEFK